MYTDMLRRLTNRRFIIIIIIIINIPILILFKFLYPLLYLQG